MRPLLRAGIVVAGIVTVQVLLMLWFAWPASNAHPHHLPIVVVGSGPETREVADMLRQAMPDEFDITVVPDWTAADKLLSTRKAYVAVMLDGSDGYRIASAAGPAVAATVMQALDAPDKVVDVVRLPDEDPRGAGFVAAFLPLLLTSIVAGAALVFAVTLPAVRLAGLLGYGVLSGLAGVLAVPGVTGDGYLAPARAVGLLALAVAATVAGLGTVLGRAGVAAGAVLVFVIGHPLSGLSSAPELLPTPWGAIGQWLPPGAGGSLLRSAAYFHGAGGARPALILSGYALVGLILVGVGALRRKAEPAEPAEQRA